MCVIPTHSIRASCFHQLLTHEHSHSMQASHGLLRTLCGQQPDVDTSRCVNHVRDSPLSCLSALHGCAFILQCPLQGAYKLSNARRCAASKQASKPR
eukprot:1154203-Pelagomonas_calceolata.AAC.12